MPTKKRKRKPMKFRPGFEYVMLGELLKLFQPDEPLDYEQILEVLRRFVDRPDNRDVAAFIEVSQEVFALMGPGMLDPNNGWQVEEW